MANNLEWKTYDKPHRRRAPDWYFAVGIISASLIITSTILDNFLFAILIFISTIVLFIYTFQEPRVLHCELTQRGIRVNKAFTPYSALESFWIDEAERKEPVIIIKQRALIAPFFTVPLGNEGTNAIRSFLSEKLPEVELHEPLSKRIMEYLGF